MRAQPAATMEEALARRGQTTHKYKLDGARVQVHKSEEEVHVYTRQLNDVTVAVPEVVEAVKGLPARTMILDGEDLAMKDDGTPFPFQTTMRRFGRRLDVETLRVELPLRAFFFDCLYCDDLDLIDHAGAERVAVLHRMLPPALAVPRTVTDRVAEAERFMAEARERGHEGVMAKSLSAAYEAGNRGSGWLKIKAVHTLDLVILAAEWGNGRRQGWLSNLHLGTRGPSGGWKLRSTRCSAARAIPAASRCVLRASSVTGRTSVRRMPTQSIRCAPFSFDSRRTRPPVEAERIVHRWWSYARRSTSARRRISPAALLIEILQKASTFCK